jgi:hypothetical protein
MQLWEADEARAEHYQSMVGLFATFVPILSTASYGYIGGITTVRIINIILCSNLLVITLAVAGA